MVIPTKKTPFRAQNTGAFGSLKDKKTIHYEPGKLKRMQHVIKHDIRYRILPFGTATRIRELRLHVKKRKHCHRPKWIQHPSRSIGEHLSKLRKINQSHTGNIIVGQCNIQSIKAKCLQVSDLLHDYSLDVLLLTETCLTNKDKIWIDSSNFNKDPYKLYTVHRSSGQREVD